MAQPWTAIRADVQDCHRGGPSAEATMSGGNDGAGLTVLAVDDERGALSMLVEVLDAEPRIGTVLQASNATEALSALRGENRIPTGGPPDRVDVVFLDIRMPGLDGLELARVLGMIPN